MRNGRADALGGSTSHHHLLPTSSLYNSVLTAPFVCLSSLQFRLWLFPPPPAAAYSRLTTFLWLVLAVDHSLRSFFRVELEIFRWILLCPIKTKQEDTKGRGFDREWALRKKRKWFSFIGPSLKEIRTTLRKWTISEYSMQLSQTMMITIDYVFI